MNQRESLEQQLAEAIDAEDDAFAQIHRARRDWEERMNKVVVQKTDAWITLRAKVAQLERKLDDLDGHVQDEEPEAHD